MSFTWRKLLVILVRARTPNDGSSEFIHWRGYEPEDDTMLDWAAVKDLAALDDYSKENPHLNLGQFDIFR